MAVGVNVTKSDLALAGWLAGSVWWEAVET